MAIVQHITILNFIELLWLLPIGLPSSSVTLSNETIAATDNISSTH